MISTPPNALQAAAETRRREMPASVALVILTGGIAAAIMKGSGAVGWAAIMSLLLILDAELYRRLDVSNNRLGGRTIAGLAAWAFLSSAFYAVLPVSLWLHGEAAGAAAAMVLWVAGVVRHFSPGVSGRLPIAIAGAAPPALTLMASPLMMAAMANRPDWDLAIIAAVGGAALMAYVTQARMSAEEAERALRNAQKQERLQRTLAELLIEDEQVALVLLDLDGRVVTASRGITGRMGVPDLRGVLFEDLVPIARDRWRAAFERSLAGERVYHEEDELALKSGRQWYNWETRPWRDEDGMICGVFAAGRDITSLVAARKVAAGNHNLLRVALDAGASVIWEVDYKLRAITWYGDHKCVYPEAFTFDQFAANTTTIIHAEDRELLADYFHGVAAGESGSIEHRVMHADGTVTWAQIWARRGLSRSGQVRNLIVMSKDITERKRQEASVIAAMQRAEATLRAKRTLVRNVAEPSGQVEVSIRDADFSVADMYEHLAKLMEEMEARDAVLAETLASLKAAREAADAANVSKSQFLASMSHELRTPLNAIIGYSEILQEEAEADGRETDLADIQRVLSSARQLLHLINDILDLSKIEAGRMDVTASEFDLRAVVEEAVATVRPSVEKNGNRLKVEIDPQLGAAVTDSFKLNQCLLNLLSNAAKFTRDGEIKLEARRIEEVGGDIIEIAVSDSGIGMSPEQTQRLFNAFVQAEATTASRFGGTGLGLVITRRTMQLLGGDVDVASEQGRGSTFTLHFPAYLRIKPTPARDTSARKGDGGDRVVLVIDDAEAARDLAARSLSRLGFDVRATASGKEGLAAARELAPHLILLDLNLPDVSGWEIMKELAASAATRDIPIVVHSVEDDRARAIGAGACDLLVKPVDRDLLAASALRFARAPETTKPAAQAALPIAKKTA